MESDEEGLRRVGGLFMQLGSVRRRLDAANLETERGRLQKKKRKKVGRFVSLCFFGRFESVALNITAIYTGTDENIPVSVPI